MNRQTRTTENRSLLDWYKVAIDGLFHAIAHTADSAHAALISIVMVIAPIPSARAMYHATDDIWLAIAIELVGAVAAFVLLMAMNTPYKMWAWGLIAIYFITVIATIGAEGKPSELAYPFLTLVGVGVPAMYKFIKEGQADEEVARADERQFLRQQREVELENKRLDAQAKREERMLKLQSKLNTEKPPRPPKVATAITANGNEETVISNQITAKPDTDSTFGASKLPDANHARYRQIAERRHSIIAAITANGPLGIAELAEKLRDGFGITSGIGEKTLREDCKVLVADGRLVKQGRKWALSQSAAAIELPPSSHVESGRGYVNGISV